MYADYQDVWKTLTAPGGDFEIVTQELRGYPIRAYANAPHSLRDVFLSSAQYADRDYLIFNEERLTYTQAHDQVRSIGLWLISRNVQPGDRVAIAMRNYPEWLLAYWATLSIGATVVGMNAWWTSPEMAYALNDAKPKVIVVDQERFERIQALPNRNSLEIVGVRLKQVAADVTPWSELTACAGQLPSIDIDPDDDACIFYTSGTTGNPKGAELTHRGCVNNVWSLMFAAALQRTLA